MINGALCAASVYVVGNLLEDKGKMGDYFWHNFRRISNGYFSCCHGFRSVTVVSWLTVRAAVSAPHFLLREKVVTSVHVCVGGRGSTFFKL